MMAPITVALLALWSCCHLPFSEALDKVSIRIVARPKTDVTASPEGPIPFRDPAAPAGPFASFAPTIGCMQNISIDLGGESASMNICYFKNTTFVSPNAEAGKSRKIMGIYKGWSIDPSTLKYKTMIFDDGDLCGDTGKRYKFSLEVVPTDSTSLDVYDFQAIDDCTFTAKVSAHITDKDISAPDGIQSPGVVDTVNPDDFLPKVCGDMKCNYAGISAKIESVKKQIKEMSQQIQELSIHPEASASASASRPSSSVSLTLSSAQTILLSSSHVMARATELLEEVEVVQHSVAAKLNQQQESNGHDQPVGDDSVGTENAPVQVELQQQGSEQNVAEK